MTRRIAFAILLIVWLALLTAGVSTYFIARALLVADLDATIIGRAASRPELERPGWLPEEASTAGDRFVIRDTAGRLIASTPTTRPGRVPPPEVIGATFTQIADGSRLRSLTLRAYPRQSTPGAPLAEPVIVVYSAPAERVDALLSQILWSLSAFGLLAGGGTAIAARSVAHAALRPMRDTAEVIGAIDEKSLDRRIDVDRLPAELAPVGRRLNDMLLRLETAFAQHRQFMADASHELRTPVAALVTTLEVALRRGRNPEDYVRVLESCLSDARQLHALVAALMEQVRSQRFAGEGDLAPVHIAAVLGRCADMAAVLAEPRGVRVEREIPEDLVVLSDEQKIRSIVTNLLSNAVEYTAMVAGERPGGGYVRVRAFLADAGNMVVPESLRSAVPEELRTQPRRLVVEVRDNGPGIPPEHLPQVFEPFYRADKARESVKNHLGLGLSIVKNCVDALGGTCDVKSDTAGESRGCTFIVTLPTVEMRSIEMAVGAPADKRIREAV